MRSLGALETWLAEETLDELDLVAADPSMLAGHGTSSVRIHDFVRVRERLAHYVFISIEPDVASRRLEIRTIGHYARPADP